MSEPTYPIPTSTMEYYRALPEPSGAPPRERYWLHALLLLVTVLTTLVVGSRMEFNFRHDLPPLMVGNGLVPFFPVEWVLAHPSRLLLGIPFSATLLVILLAHEMGHYLMCRYYEVRATLPFFIPAPTVIGTLGAVIRIKAPIRSRAALFDIGIAGPIAGFTVALAALAVALNLSKPLGSGVGRSDLELGLPQIFFYMQSLLRSVVPGQAIAALPLARVYLHPTAVAAWVGMYATALNLLPSGQLDGGHIVYALAPRAHRAISWISVFGLAYLGSLKVGMGNDVRFNYAWWIWGGLITVMNILTYRQEQAPEYPLLPASRWLLALLGAIMLALTFTVVPFRTN
jgi:membrane-associated protease RseP (regulator of RpoE activity)